MFNAEIFKKVQRTDRACYFLAKLAVENCGERQIVTWIRSPHFERVLKEYFGKSVAFGVSFRKEACDGKNVRSFDVLSVKEHYLVSLDRAFDDGVQKQLSVLGYIDFRDVVFLRHKPIVLENFVCSTGEYQDNFGNVIITPPGTKFRRVILRGCGSRIQIGNSVAYTENITFDIASNAYIEVKDRCAFNAAVKFEVFGHSGSAVISIGERCRFTDALFRLYVSPFETAVVINDDCSFETHFEAHANVGKRIVLGKDCMISHEVQLWAGDGHPIFDVNTGANINSDYLHSSPQKNSLVLGNHVWVGYRAFIMHGTNVGSGSIIGAGCVVKGIFSNNCAIGGNPAKMLRSDCAWARDMGVTDIRSIKKEYAVKTLKAKAPIVGENFLNICDDGKELYSFDPSVKREVSYGIQSKNIYALAREQCTGCAACVNICPKKCIQMVADQNGYMYPQIDMNLCVSCGLCKKVCPKLNAISVHTEPKECYAFMADDETRKVSASGGAFSACAEYVLEQGGVVCGAAWTEEFGLRHIIVENKLQLDLIRGSKYLQSNIGESFREVKNYLTAGRIVLFVGTPCQVDGLKHYLGKEYDTLYTMDLLCRGVPPAGLFQRYLKEEYGDERLQKIVQKSKKRAGWGAYTEIVHSSGYSEHYNMENNIWMKTFLSDLIFRDSCYKCPYSQVKRTGDLSVGDFWQVTKLKKEYDDRLGTSIVIASTEKGKELIENVRMKLREKVPLRFEVQYNSALWSARKIPEARKLFFELLKKIPIGAALDRVLYKKKYDIGIVGWWANLNYGGTLTYYALSRAIQSLGYSVMMIRSPYSDAPMVNENTVPMRFAKKHYTISRIYAHRDMHLLNYACKGFVSGSDQLWNPTLEKYAGKECFLSFANKNSIRVSYASSFGNVSSFPESFIAKYKPELEKFDAVSVREDYAVELCKKHFGVEAAFVCDPVFLCDRLVYQNLAEQSNTGFPGKYVLNFILDPNDEKSKAIQYIANKKAAEFVCFTDLQNVEQKKAAFRLQNVYANAPIEDLLRAYLNCDFVVTDSFHGTCFAIIFNKPFISIANFSRGAKRFESLLRWTGLTDRMVNSIKEIFEKENLLKPIEYEQVNQKVAAFKERSLNWLKSALLKMKY